MKQQTAVSWLQDKLKETYEKEGRLPLAYTLHLVKQAKQMEKEQIIGYYLDGAYDESDNHGAQYIGRKEAEQYYNETYNK